LGSNINKKQNESFLFLAVKIKFSKARKIIAPEFKKLFGIRFACCLFRLSHKILKTK